MNRPHPMAPLPVALLGLALAASPAAAGEPLGSDLFAGYSYLKLDEVSRNGADLALAFRAIGPLAGFVDVSTHWGNDAGLSLNDLTLMAGPGFRFGKQGGTLFFVRALAGLVRDKATISVLDVDIAESDSRFGLMAGAGVDFRVTRKLAGRVQADYLWNDASGGNASCAPGVGGCSDSGGGSSSGFRVSAGLVYRFGRAP